MDDIIDLKWQTGDEMPHPTNALQELCEILTRTSRDTGEDKMIACMYGIIVGWNDESYEELRLAHNWTDENIQHQKMLHENYKKAWALFMEQEDSQ